MKRTQAQSALATDASTAAMPAKKKLKTAARASVEASTPAPVASPSYAAFPEKAASAADEGGDWTKVGKRKAKKLKKKIEARADESRPKFMYAKGEILKRNEAVGIHDIRELVLHLTADAPPPSWVRVENPGSIQKVVVLLIPGITRDTLALPPLPTAATANPNLPIPIPLPRAAGEGGAGAAGGLPFIAGTFSHACPTRAPGDQTRMHSVLSAFFQGPITREEKKRRMAEWAASERAEEKTPVDYLLTTEQMIENDYPVPSYVAEVFEKPPGWVETPAPAADASAESPRIYAIDCEMCMTEDGKELTRVCIIDYASGIAVYDQLVKPRKPILDYLTRWSGITAEKLDPVTTRFEEVQAHVLSVLSARPTPILLGHSLESDLKALKICHPQCIDTALLYHHPRGRPLKPGLAWLTRRWCGREIQNRGEGGHDPEEDARACMELLAKKVENGPGFGEFKVDMESIFERMGRAKAGMTTAIADHGNPAAWHGSKATTTVACKTDAEVLDGMLGAIPSHDFVFGRFTALADALGWITNKASGDSVPDTPAVEPAPADMSALLATLDTQLKQLYAALPRRTALVIFTGHSDPRKMAELNARKAVFEDALKSGKTAEDLGKAVRWTGADGRALEEEVEKAKRGLLFLGIKESS
ncbi:hypothetical protein WOLCODRAFT_138067 [Wolfiporia cocos MD-104 SS10]|uniref:Exonuclease domain-containing protein n=1 Tax=Wolfiporia cocos (strain MD-104) TaxID=742152 RepID=A0A2H3JY35_WOLCO|nr:hypothetical protein WOLCODRAFT_138067 [Wolfiporia cocos MD-104 SS10]